MPAQSTSLFAQLPREESEAQETEPATQAHCHSQRAATCQWPSLLAACIVAQCRCRLRHNWLLSPGKPSEMRGIL